MESDFSAIQDYIDQLNNDKITCERRLVNAGKLIGLLGDEGERWLETVDGLNKEVEKLIGNVFIAAASISYMGPFTVNIFRFKYYRDLIEINSLNNGQAYAMKQKSKFQKNTHS